MRSVKSKILIILICLTLAFIWGNSILTVEASSRISNTIVKALQELGLFSHNSSDVASNSVRKSAHFIEYFVLGGLVLPFLKEQKFNNSLSYLIFLGIAVPFIDETIQIFSNRGPMISDMWIDLAGFSCGTLIVYTVTVIYDKVINIKRRKL